MQFSKTISAAVVLTVSSLALLQPAVSAPLMLDPGLAKSTANVEAVQYRHGHGGWRHHGGGRGYGRGYGNGGAVLGGLAAGALIGGAIASSQARAADTSGYCAQRFRSYDPASGTYLGNDGLRHSCP